jgi:hypothetical protein
LSRYSAILFAILGLALLVVPFTLAAETTRDEYVAMVEPICKTNQQASDKYLKGVRNLVKRDKLDQASRRFAKAAAALEKAYDQLAVVPQPPGDAPKLTKWLAGIKAEVALMRKIGKKLGQGGKARASSLAVKLTHDANTTNNLVIGFQFHYCKLDPSKYT